MIDFQFRVIEGDYHPQFRVRNLKDALDACLFVLCDLKHVNNWYLALSSLGADRQSFPNIHIQALDGNFFCQVFLEEENSPNREEGWFTLFRNPAVVNCQPFTLTDELFNEEKEQFFEASFSQGVYFNKKFFVSREVVIENIQRFAVSGKDSWAKTDEWINLGLI